MICVNELTALNCNNRQVLADLMVLISPYAPHITEELWSLLGNKGSIVNTPYPVLNETFLQEDEHEYPIAINGKMRVKISFPVDKPHVEIQAEVLANENVQKWLEGKTPKKIIVVPKKIVNIVI